MKRVLQVCQRCEALRVWDFTQYKRYSCNRCACHDWKLSEVDFESMAVPIRYCDFQFEHLVLGKDNEESIASLSGMP